MGITWDLMVVWNFTNNNREDITKKMMVLMGRMMVLHARKLF
jgi:hypothetical protein